MSVRVNGKIIAGNSMLSSYRYIGEIFTSTIPITDPKVRLANGQKISLNEGYDSFIQYMNNIVSLHPEIACSEEEWTSIETSFGECGKYVVAESYVRLPKIVNPVKQSLTSENFAKIEKQQVASSETGDVVIQHINYFNYIVLASGIIQNINVDVLAGKANTALDNLTADGEKHFVNKSQITDCILEAPERINLELSEGILTLKAGSIVVIPNGFEDDETTPKFDYLEIKEDKTVGVSFTAFDNYAVTYCVENDYLVVSSILASGEDPLSLTKSTLYYNTKSNKISKFGSGGQTVIEPTNSLPLALVSTSDSTKIAAINQIYNNASFCGSTLVIYKGLKTLMSNGKNKDRTFKNLEYTLDKTIIVNITVTTSRTIFLANKMEPSWLNNQANFMYKVYKQDSVPTDMQYNTMWKNTNENKWYFWNSDISPDWTEIVATPILRYTTDGTTTITSLTFYEPVLLPKEQDLIGSWVSSNKTIADSIAISSNNKTFDLSDYLPNDGNIYEVLLRGNILPGTTQKNYLNLYVSSDIMDSLGVCGNRCMTTGTQPEGTGTVLLPVGISRQVTVSGVSSTNASGTYSLYARGYRKSR